MLRGVVSPLGGKKYDMSVPDDDVEEGSARECVLYKVV